MPEIVSKQRQMKKWEEHDAERYAPSMSCQSLGGIPVGGGRAGGGSHNPKMSIHCISGSGCGSSSQNPEIEHIVLDFGVLRLSRRQG